jgi:type I restriction enzyme, S subunit
MNGLVETPFKLTLEEMLYSAAATLCLFELRKIGSPLSSISEVCYTPQYGFTASASLEQCGPRFVRITDIKGGTINWNMVPFCECPDPSGYELKSGDILIARSGSIGKSFLVTNVPEIAVFASYMIRLRTKSEFTPSYVYWCLQSQQFWQQITEAKRGSAMNNINGKMLSSLKFPTPSRQIQDAMTSFLDSFKKHLKKKEESQHLAGFPSFLYEPQRMVARIEEMATRIEEARGLRREAVEETEAFTASVTNVIFNSNKSDNWFTVSLGEVADIQSGVTLGRILNGPTVSLPYLRVANVQDGHLDLSTIKEIEILATEFEKWQLKLGDILLTEGGDWDKLGRGTVWRGEIPDCIHQNHIFRIRTNPKDFDPNFLITLFNSPYVKTYFREASKQTTNLASINQKQLKAFKVFQPPLVEQQRIAAYLDGFKSKVKALKRIQSETSDELNALLPSILDKAFKGEL